MLNENEQKKYDVIEKVVKGLITKKEAMCEANLGNKFID